MITKRMVEALTALLRNQEEDLRNYVKVGPSTSGPNVADEVERRAKQMLDDVAEYRATHLELTNAQNDYDAMVELEKNPPKRP